MTVLGLRMAEHRNAVSRLHGEVTRRIWQGLWPQVQQKDVPIFHVTNGVHLPTWLAPELAGVYRRHLGTDLLARQDEAALWGQMLSIPDEQLWATHMLLKRKLMRAIRERAQKAWAEGLTARQVLAMGTLLEPEVLTIAFVRRFVEYKRPTLLFQDVERLKRIVTNPRQPVQLVFAGKSHPADLPSKHLLHKVYTLASDRGFQGRIAFVEDYDIHMAHYLVQGADVWLNTPQRLLEASGTSGMKAALNGALNLSVLDGWWHEGFNGANGWAIADGPEAATEEKQGEADAEALYDLLEGTVVPLYYEQNGNGVPRHWVRMVKESIRSIVPTFCARRMMKEYTERAYLPAVSAFQTISSPKAH
jgi:starch phosphorylase